MSSREILLLCASGLSNESIERQLDISTKEIKVVLKKYFSFEGWNKDQPINPVFIYNKFCKKENKQDYDLQVLFINKVKSIHPSIDNDTMLTMFRICKLFYNLESGLIDNWK
jgi:hypothetical protein